MLCSQLQVDPLCRAVLCCLLSRAIAQANITREYLHTLVQNDYKMPSGPVIISPHGLLPSLYRWGDAQAGT
jgi:phosphatidate phosphatase PAH1